MTCPATVQKIIERTPPAAGRRQSGPHASARAHPELDRLRDALVSRADPADELTALAALLRRNLTPLALRPRDAAKALGVSPRHLWQLTRDGHVPCVRVGTGKRQTVLYPVAELQAWLSRQSEASKGGAR